MLSSFKKSGILPAKLRAIKTIAQNELLAENIRQRLEQEKITKEDLLETQAVRVAAENGNAEFINVLRTEFRLSSDELFSHSVMDDDNSAAIVMRSSKLNSPQKISVLNALADGVDPAVLIMTRSQGDNLLHLAAIENLEIMTLLVGILESSKTPPSLTYNLSVVNNVGDTPIVIAAQNGKREIAEFLESKGVNKELRSGDKASYQAALGIYETAAAAAAADFQFSLAAIKNEDGTDTPSPKIGTPVASQFANSRRASISSQH